MPSLGSANQIFVPENCLIKKETPCLLKSNSYSAIKKEKFEYRLQPTTILRWNKFGSEMNMELMQGAAYIKLDEEQKEIILNGISFKSRELFVLRNESDLKVLDMKNYILTQYQLPRGRGTVLTIAQSDFLSKVDLVHFISKYFKSKSDLVVYLKSIEKSWKKEFVIQTANQTKVLKRSIASIEQEEKQKVVRKQNQVKELKKVRETFFNRTFHR